MARCSTRFEARLYKNNLAQKKIYNARSAKPFVNEKSYGICSKEQRNQTYFQITRRKGIINDVKAFVQTIPYIEINSHFF